MFSEPLATLFYWYQSFVTSKILSKSSLSENHIIRKFKVKTLIGAYNPLSLLFMQLKRKISALFFLLVISLVMMHNVFPHMHHILDESAVSSEHVGHHHGHDHHHANHHHSHDQDPQKEAHQGLLSIFLENHSHQDHFHGLIELVKLEKRNSQLKVFSMDMHLEKSNLSPGLYSQSSKRYIHTKPRCKRNPYLSNCSLRAPPFLG
ncbi:hypothetical protein QQ008_26005 [Fulvivirgaceae bacterium BMA10]|uniref:Uncharacterized protein n=1 Tax=Splendidivirga corallicola TaxID=3051826 RepID=A0ABT8KY59_9BACT|nr:hypothetical protein [Fulvivirgaceae bacterium BMA10]